MKRSSWLGVIPDNYLSPFLKIASRSRWPSITFTISNGKFTRLVESHSEQAAYDAAFKSLRAGDYVTASRGFRDFLTKYPDSALAPNAYYWLGESYYVTMNYPVAIEAFQRLVKQYPQSDKVSDGLLKVGYCQIELKQQDAAIATLKQVSAKYPGTKAAGLAQERLRRLQRQTAN